MRPETNFTAEEVARHNKPDDLYLIVSGNVYDCTKFALQHPGGATALYDVGGEDATQAFDDTGHSDKARKLMGTMEVGVLSGAGMNNTHIPSPGKIAVKSRETTQYSALYLVVAVLACVIATAIVPKLM